MREIAECVLNLEEVRTDLIKGLQKYHEEVLTEPDEDQDLKENVLEEQQINEELIQDAEENASEVGLSINESS